MINGLSKKKLKEIKAKFCEWGGDNPETMHWTIPGGVTGNTQAVRLTCTDGDYIVAHDFDRDSHDRYIEVTKFYSNEDIDKMRKEYTND